jgi:hypothetical protein
VKGGSYTNAQTQQYIEWQTQRARTLLAPAGSSTAAPMAISSDESSDDSSDEEGEDTAGPAVADPIERDEAGRVEGGYFGELLLCRVALRGNTSVFVSIDPSRSELINLSRARSALRTALQQIDGELQEALDEPVSMEMGGSVVGEDSDMDED